jgi:SAM-dependent methyltransferase
MLSVDQWHERFRQQARWTHAARQRVYQLTGIPTAREILDVGCGTGALEEELASLSQARLTGLDLSRENLSFHRENADNPLVAGDAHHLPFRNAAFDIAFCHYLLLWVSDPVSAITEMRRVTCPGGFVIALAEPDYSKRIEYPTELQEVSKLQREALIQAGANPDIGSSLGGLFHSAGLQVIEIGLTGGRWQSISPDVDSEIEWQIFEDDLQHDISIQEIERFRYISETASSQGTRVSFLPVFYAVGQVK